MGFKASLTGDLGSGKSTVANILIPKWNVEYYGTGVICREIAASMGMGVDELNVYMETHKELDAEFDNRLIRLSDDERSLIIDSRMAWHFTKGTYKIYLTVDPMSSAARIMRAGRSTEQFASIEEAAARIKTRKESEKKRYFDLYGVNCKDLRNYNLVVDTTYASPEEVADLIDQKKQVWEQNENLSEIYVCPKRLKYPDDEANMELVSTLSEKLEQNEKLGPVSVVFENENFYVVDGAEVALVYSLNNETFVPVTLVDKKIEEQNFISMEDHL